MKVRVTRTALRQIEVALAYVEPRSPTGAATIRQRLLAVLAILVEHPFAGQTTTRPGVRRLPLTPMPYVIYYRLTETDVVVTRFQHAARGSVA